MKDLTGATLGKYQVLERLGRGGMADVYRAYQPGMDRYVAIKVLHGHLSEDTGFIARFKREAQSVGTLRHPNIVQVIDFDAVDDEYYMVMEFIDGDTLKALLSRRGALPVTEAIALMVKIADAVSYAHRAGMIHRDIKPANIMMTAAGEPILTDFGIAKILSATNLTATGVAVGTPAYMSPEAGRGEKVDERADIYSLGIMLYEMVTGAPPFDADTPWAVILKHINEPLPRPTAVLPSLPQSMEKILLKALTKAPDDRYQTAADFREALVKAGQALADPQLTAPAVAVAAPPASDSPTTQIAKKTETGKPVTSGARSGRLIFWAAHGDLLDRGGGILRR
jgi:serine/threonine protein kinase